MVTEEIKDWSKETINKLIRVVGEDYITNSSDIAFQALKEIERLQALIETQKWISVDDRLPENNTVVYVFNGGCTNKRQRGVFQAFYKDDYWYEPKYLFEDSPDIVHFWSMEITHWFPLLQHPQEES